MRHYWLATEILTGRPIADLPRLSVPKAKRILGRYEPATATLPFDGAPADWQRVFEPGATGIWLLRDDPSDPAHGIPIWGGYITDRPLTSGDAIEFPMMTWEHYLDRRFVGDRTYASVDQNLIVKDLVERFVAAGPNGGLPIRVNVLGGGGKVRDRTYTDRDDKTIYSVLRDLMGVIDGPEWTIGGEWKSGPDRLVPVLHVGGRIGVAKRAELMAPAAVFDMPGPVFDFKHYTSYSNGKGANAVKAVSSGQGDERPESQLVVTPDLMRPTFEHRFTPSTSIKETATLDAHANARAALLNGGTLTLELSAHADSAPGLDIDWSIGDDVGYDITAPAFPGGLTGVARAVGWELSPEGTATITPILAGGDLDKEA